MHVSVCVPACTSKAAFAVNIAWCACSLTEWQVSTYAWHKFCICGAFSSSYVVLIAAWKADKVNQLSSVCHSVAASTAKHVRPLKSVFHYSGEGCVHSDFTAYSNAKLYNQLTAVELQKRLEGTGVDIYVAQPGMSKTGLFSKGDHSKWGVFFQVHLLHRTTWWQ